MANLVRISEAALLAIHTMALLAREPHEHFTNEMIAQRLGFGRSPRESHAVTGEGPLGRVGAWTSRGFRLGVCPKAVGLLQIYEVVEGPISDAAGVCPLPDLPAGKRTARLEPLYAGYTNRPAIFSCRRPWKTYRSSLPA